MKFVLLVSVFVIATCGLIYELITSTLASYLLGDTVTQFSTVIGVYLFSMGIGSYLSGKIHKNLLRIFVQVEILIGFMGGTSSALLFLLFDHVGSFRVLLYTLISMIGTLVGLEIPLLMRILKDHFEFRDLVSKVFTFDYVGALLASIIFPLVLVPKLGLVRSSFFFGILNTLVALWTLWAFKLKQPWAKALQVQGLSVFILLLIGFVSSDSIVSYSEASIYGDAITFSKSSPYQRLLLTQSKGDLRLFLNGNLQFSSRDEYRYHETLVHVGLTSLPEAKKVLVLGGGDGLAVREILKYPRIQEITLVDLDAAMTELFSKREELVKLNQGSLISPRLKIIHDDAFQWLKKTDEKFDFVIADFPDPSNFSLGKLYSQTFYRTLKTRVQDHGLVVVQSTSPYYARKSYWCIAQTLESVGWTTLPYHAHVPAFGEWGFILAGKTIPPIRFDYPPNLKFLDQSLTQSMFHFPKDISRVPTEVNRLNNQALVKFFEEEWSEYVK